MNERRPSICIVGSSFVGALFAAFRKDPNAFPSVNVGFFATGAVSFANIDIKDGKLVNARVKNAWTDYIGSYDVIFIYAQFPTPYDVAHRFIGLAHGDYSEQVRRAAIQDMMTTSPSWRLRDKIRKVTTAPVYVLSANVPQLPGNANPKRYHLGVALITEIIGPEIYHPFPDEVFDERAAPKLELYKGALGVDGLRPDLPPPRSPDVNHMNEIGGAVVLRSMTDRVKGRLTDPNSSTEL
jgi:hypothetical protein